MTRKFLSCFALIVTGLLFAPWSARGAEHGNAPGGQRSESLSDLNAADDFKGMRVEDMQGRQIGAVNGLIVDAGVGRIAYIVVGTAEKSGGQVIVPWSAMQLQKRPAQGTMGRGERVLVLDLSQDDLNQAPRVGSGRLPDLEEGREIHEFYGVSPYWEQGSGGQGMQPSAPSLPEGHPPVLPPGHPPVVPPGHPPVSPDHPSVHRQ